MLKDTVFTERNPLFDSKLVNKLSAELSVSMITARVLANRGIKSIAEAESFLYPGEGSFYDPFLLPDMEAAVERIQEAIECDERICIYGDYDTDGVCATAILYKTLKKFGANVEYYVPSRHEDGYGMHRSTVEKLCESGVDLIITVDNGITAIDEIRLCTDYCTDVIVTDHHLPGELLGDAADYPEGAVIIPNTRKIIPDCVAVVAPSRDDSEYPFSALCGAGVAYKLSVALNRVYGSDSDSKEHELIGLAAIATVADVVSLTGENRSIVKAGLPFISINKGISLLLENAGFTGNADEQTIGFVISPRINAAGRMGDASRAIRLLITDEYEERILLSDELQQDNDRRRAEESRVIKDIFKSHAVEELSGLKAIVIKGEDWNPGVLGIAASRLEEQFYCPVLLFTRRGENYVGSGRSIPGVHLHELLTPLQRYFARFGGHAMAVGITIENEKNFESFAADFTAACNRIEDSNYIKKLVYDQIIDLSQTTSELVEELSRLAPFGEGNPVPVFLSENVSLGSFRKIGKNEEHLDGCFCSEKNKRPFIAFKMGNRFDGLKANTDYDVLYTVLKDSYRGEDSIKLSIVEFKNETKNNDDFLTKSEYNKICCFDAFSKRILRPERYETISREAFGKDKMRKSYMRLSELIASHRKEELSVSERISLCVFFELGFFVMVNGRIELAKAPIKRALTESGIYQLIMPKN